MTSEPESDQVLVARRVISAPRERVFATYVDPARLDRWLGAARIRRIDTESFAASFAGRTTIPLRLMLSFSVFLAIR